MCRSPSYIRGLRSDVFGHRISPMSVSASQPACTPARDEDDSSLPPATAATSTNMEPNETRAIEPRAAEHRTTRVTADIPIPLPADIMVVAGIMSLAAVGIDILHYATGLLVFADVILGFVVARARWPINLRYYLLATVATIAARDGSDAVFYVPLCVLGVALLRLAMERGTDRIA